MQFPDGHEILSASSLRKAVYEASTYLIAPGSTITSAAAIVVAMGKVEESTILTEPPDNGVLGTFENSNENACGGLPAGLDTGTASSEGGAMRNGLRISPAISKNFNTYCLGKCTAPFQGSL